MKRLVFAVLAALLAGCAMPPVVYVPAQVVYTCPTATVGRWQYNPQSMKWDCVIPSSSTGVVVVEYRHYPVYGPPQYHPHFGWGVVVVIRSGGHSHW
ncbi:hypothetical protein HY478_00250 [Candidatus Uhrbacteria bacterium]|nr:hypothetical protein [Candidatus Uhrbacteria bacterium]